MISRTLSLWISICLLSFTLFPLSFSAAVNKSDARPNDQTSSKTISDTEQAKVDDQVSEKRKEIINEAVAAIDETKKTLIALENNKKQEALEALGKALGDLEVVLARDPNLAFAPIDIQITIQDSESTLVTIEQARKQAIDYLEDKEIQKARGVLNKLINEVVLSVTSIPLATYPEVIKDVIPLIDANKIKEAKTALQTALSSLTVTDYIIPMPIIRADESLEKAQALTKKANLSKVENDALIRFIGEARLQLEIAEALGYGDQYKYAAFYENLDKLEDKIGGNIPGSGYLEEIRKFLSGFLRPFDKE